jgi:hypothetical protein
MFCGHAFREIGLWDMAYAAYVKAAGYREFARDKSEAGLEALTKYCAEMRDGRKPSSKSGEGKATERKLGLVKGLLRCGTFGDLAQMASGDGAGIVRNASEPQQQTGEQGVCDSLGPREDNYLDEHMEIEGDPGTDDHDDAQDTAPGEIDIDWLAIGGSESRTGATAHVRTSPRFGYPPLRSARGKLITWGKLWHNRSP